jgi:excisionase family DNA binding protein
MRTDHPLTLTVEQAAEVLGVGRSTAYELVRSGDLTCIRLRRRIVVPVAHLPESLGVDREAVWSALDQRVQPASSATHVAPSSKRSASSCTSTGEPLTLFRDLT